MRLQLAYIAPTKYLNAISSKGGILLALAHLIDDNGRNEYARYHRRKAEQGYRVICDNGLFEGTQVDPEALLRRAGAIGAHVVCAPDTLYSKAGTVKAFKEFIRLKQERGMVIDVMGIPQADNPIDWWECFKFMDLSPDCSIIGLSILSVPRAFNEFLGTKGITGARTWLIEQLYLYEILLGRKLTPCHLLGLGESLSDLTIANRLLPHTVVSNDSSSCYMSGKYMVRYSQLGTIPGGKISEKVNFDTTEELSIEQLRLIKTNMEIAYNLANHNWNKR